LKKSLITVNISYQNKPSGIQ